MATLSNGTGIALGYKTDGASDFVTLTNLQEIPEIGNNTPEKIDITVLSDTERKYMNGITDVSQDIAFKFLYEDAQFTTLAGLEGSCNWSIDFAGLTATFKATPNVKLDGVGVNAPLTYTLTLSVESLIEFA